MTTPISAKEIKRNWHLLDLSGQTLGRVSTIIAELLIGKGKVNQTPNLIWAFVVAINAAKIKVTGKKLADRNIAAIPVFRAVSAKNLGELMKEIPAR